MNRLHLGIVLHNHQPVGNYGSVIEQVYEQAYAPMLEALERHPGIRVALHNSGCLFDWIEANRPDYIHRLRSLCDRGQVEMMTGGYYEPVLPMIPDGDKRGQIAKLTAYIEERFGQRPSGLWLTERVWEPGLPAPLADAGIEWTLVDDAHFRMVGMGDEQLDGYYITEDQGKRIKLFAGSQRLRYTIPWSDVDDVITELRSLADAGMREAPYVVLGDDGEKFGAWPTTYEHVWSEGWIERFFSAIEQQGDWLEATTPGEYARRFEGRGLTYLPAASYAEMMEWAMPAAASAAYRRAAGALEREGRHDVAQYMRGGFWRYFLAKYPEANSMHKRGLRIDEKLAEAESAEARNELWMGQCNCPYWHGVFGGLYLRHVRRTTNSHLVRAERLADEALGEARGARRGARSAGRGRAAQGAAGVRIVARDWDYDGHGEILMQSASISLLLHPKLGGMLSEFDLRRRDHALLDVLTRRREAYHEALLAGQHEQAATQATNIHGNVRVKEEGLVEALTFDRYRRGGLQEWIFDAGATVGEMASGRALAAFEPRGAWDAAIDEREQAVTLSRTADGWRVEKRVAMDAEDERVDVRYAVANESGEPRTGVFASEWNIAPPQAPDGDDRTAALETGDRSTPLMDGAGSAEMRCALSIRGSAQYAIECASDDAFEVWHYPVESISSSEGGVERVAQGVSVSLVRRLELAPGEAAAFGFRWGVRE